MTGAFERVAELRGMPAPKPRRDHLRVVEPEPAPPATRTHRPVRLAEMIGQPRLTTRLSAHIRAAVARGEQPGHVLLDGPSGFGKTTIAGAVAAELNACAKRSVSSEFHECIGASIPNTRKLAVQLAQLHEGDVLFIDEVATLPKAVQVAFYRALEDRVLMLPADNRNPAVTLPLPAFTVVAATTDPGKLLAPFRARFGFTGHLEQYDRDDLALLLLSYCERAGVDITVDAATTIAGAARFTPRLVIELLNSVRDYSYEVTGDPNATIDGETSLQGLEFAEVDPAGLTERDLRVLRVLCRRCVRGDPIGVKPLATSLGMDAAELVNDIEPFLVAAGFMWHLPRGRMASPAAYAALGLAVPAMVAGLV